MTSKAIDGETYLLLRLTKKWRDDISAAELYEATRGWWVMTFARAEQVTRVFAVAQGTVVAVYEPTAWSVSPHPGEENRIGFDGVEADDAGAWVGVKIDGLFKPGAANPVLYVDASAFGALYGRPESAAASEPSAFAQLSALFAESLFAKAQAFRSNAVLSAFQKARLGEAMTADIRKLCDMAVPAARPPKVSVAAHQLATSMGVDLREQTWHSQKKIDGYKLFTYEHFHPVYEIRQALMKASDVQRAMTVLDEMVSIAWVTKEEDQRLLRLGYGQKRPDPVAAYAEAGIELLPA